MKILISLFAFIFFVDSALSAGPKIELKGFGTAGMIKADHPTYYLNEYGTFGSRVGFTPDSRLGLNFSSTLGEDWSAAAQFISRADTDNYSAKLDWGFISYQPVPEFSVRAGKVITPFWLYSQQINVGYSYLWVRPPFEVYGLIAGFTSANGVSLLTKIVNGRSVFTTELVAGGAETQVFNNNPNSRSVSEIIVKDLVGLDFSYSLDDIFTLHGSIAKANVNVKNESWFSSGNNLYSKVITPISLESARFFSVGAKADYKDILFSGEFARRLLSGQSLQSASAWYATLGYRFGRFTPYTSYSWLGSLSGSYYLHPETPTISTLKKEQKSYLLGLNTQVHDSVVLKAEIQKTKFNFVDVTRDFQTNIISISADFVF